MPKFGGAWRGRLDPDGRFALWQNKRVRSYKHRVENIYGLQTLGTLQLLQESLPKGFLQTVEGWSTALMQCVSREMENSQVLDGSETLGSSKQSKTQSPRAKRGSKGITSHGKRIVRNAAGLLEAKYGKEHICFFTGTLPALTKEDENRLVSYWSGGLRNFREKLCFHLKKRGLPSVVVGCVEVQEGRRARTGELGWHLHLIFVGRKPGRTWALTLKEIQKLWSDTWQAKLKENYNWNASTQTVRVVKSVSGYLGKYLSKGCTKKTSTSGTQQRTEHPSAWFVCSDVLKRWVKMGTIVSDDMGELLKSLIQERSPSILFWSKVERVIGDGRSVPVCIYGSSDLQCYDVPLPATADFPF